MATTRKRTPKEGSETNLEGKKKTSAKAKAKARPGRANRRTEGQSIPYKVITPEERWHMISVAAYYRAERQGFVGGDPAQDWLQAEAEVDDLLRKQSTVVE